MKKLIRVVINKFGIDVIRIGPNTIGKNPMVDMARFLLADRPVILDVGANVGQSVQDFRRAFPNCAIHSFEPSPVTFERLKKNVSRLDDVHLNNFALGSSPGRLNFLENSDSVWSSFLTPGKYARGEIVRETAVEVSTVDQYCKDEGIDRVDILKSDTQGFELEVFKGAERAISEGKVGMIYFEINFSRLYENLPPFAEVFQFLTDRDFLLVTLYRFHYKHRLASWTDALVVHRSYLSGDRALV